MLKNIKHNNVRSLKFKLRNDKFYDFMLYRGECGSSFIGDDCIAAEITPYGEKNGKFISPYVWGGSVNNGVILNNIGYTGVDNGIITFRKDKISNAEFLKLYTDSEYVLEEGENNFFMQPVSGNTGRYKYFSSIEEEDGKKYFSFKGGFLQGFYKLFGEEYQTLPSVVDSEWNLEFVIRRRDYDVNYQTINHTHPENNGIFFFMGTRAENKFWESYNVDADSFLTDENKDDYFIDDSPVCDGIDYFSEEYNIPCDGVDDGYYEKDITLDDVNITTDNGKDVTKRGYYEIKTDNKFLTFDRTADGFTTKDFDPDNAEVIFEGRKIDNGENYFLLMNRTANGYTSKDIEEYHEQNQEEFDIYKDIKRNAFALKVNEDGSISYKYAVNDCDSDTKFGIAEEKTKESMVPMGEWVTINLKIQMLTPNDKCDSKVGKRKMKILIYVNGNLVLVSKELPEFRFRELDDIKEKQETVPFNISLGGGTQGLAEGIWLDYNNVPEHKLPIENHFCGSFLGDIMSFRFYECFMDHKTINERVFKL